MTILHRQAEFVDQALAMAVVGVVIEVRGMAIHVSDFAVSVGASVQIRASNQDQLVHGEVIGFDQERAIVLPIGTTHGIRPGDQVIADQPMPTVRVGDALLGRVLDGTGQPIDQAGPVEGAISRRLNSAPIDPMDRTPIDTPIATGIRAIDTLVSAGQGQRMGVFAAPGAGKSVLLGMMAKATSADVTVIGLVGERGREVRDFLQHHLGEEGLARSVVVCATSDQSPVLRIRSAQTATAIAEYFRDQGRQVLLLVDSITRYCQAQRQIGLAAGEPPTSKGYPPSVFSMLPQLLERCGRTKYGSITGFYSILTEGDELNDPIADAARGVLDGHINLSTDLANQGHWPAIDIVGSISRVADVVTDAQHQSARQRIVQLLASYQKVEDLLHIGAYAAGTNPEFDLAIACKSAIDQMLRQGASETSTDDFARTRQQLLALCQLVDRTQQQLSQPRSNAPQGPQAQRLEAPAEQSSSVMA
ncbi:MAG: EscN/YscN/HrcN family type III secretion system ATPase [Phycisphaeraceae bacterium]|nr:EscN/YscN/HrcN family type III secretion system ATPase [Phycisphaeraceae bacterium]|tara:strand:+ start:2535 stop:3959 length:1425 start_codon:yes stop_codon:yes gene_type:complete